MRVLWLTLIKYSSIDGEQRAASFAYYAFFALFPLLLLLVSVGSYFFDPAKVSTALLDAVSRYVLVDTDKHDLVRQTIHGIVRSRRGVGSFAVLGLVWSSLRFFPIAGARGQPGMGDSRVHMVAAADPEHAHGWTCGQRAAGRGAGAGRAEFH